MLRRRLFLIALGFAAFLGLAGLVKWLLRPARPRVTRESLFLLREGMTEAEVADLLGGPPDRWEDVERLPEEDRIAVGDWDEPRPWIGADCILVVRFFDGRVTDKELHERDSTRAGLLERLRRLLGW
jgi:hypothetical protein